MVSRLQLVLLVQVLSVSLALASELQNGTCYATLKTMDMSKHCGKSTSITTPLQVSITTNQYHVIAPCLNCALTLTTHAGNQLQATLVGIGTETSGTCDHNRLDVYDGKKADEKKLISAKTGICGCKFPAKIVYKSSGSALTLHLHTTCKSNVTQHGEISLVITSVKNDLYNRTFCPGKFKCGSGECLDKNLVCDGTPNCKDKSDETNCKIRNGSCPGRFECSDGLCIDKNLVCDGHKNCPDGSDEAKCSSHGGKCAGKFECTNGHCIDKNEVCDGKNNCSDHSDEKHCSFWRRNLLMYILIGVAALAAIMLLIILIVLCCKCFNRYRGYTALP